MCISCSIGCYKEHKENKCKPLEVQANLEDVQNSTDSAKYKFATEDTVPIEKLKQLRYSKELKNCLQNLHVRDIMRAVLTDKDPTKAIALAMTEPIFVEMADACLNVVEPQINDESC
ncbi:PREDICTED: zinc finger HIT domain-containing protein 3-like [Eufriesea mexicana]|uniref:zinc finger HIT domain-containing protein 3-like n=1 Tax=Eufriesea mexicana TaxID=516756 RepID=UPI00083C58EF|nr:PREDICTED: zinc finger HIT domain-containing protein 3-like [Eufriesea mexicana]